LNAGPRLDLLNLGFVIQALSVFRRTQPAAIFFNEYQPYMAWLLAVLRPRHIPFYCIQHEVEPRLGRRQIGWFQRDFYNRASAMVVHRHNHSRDLLLHKYKIRTPIVTMEFGNTQTDLFGKECAGSALHKSTILNFGEVRPDKGLDLLVKAFPGPENCNGLQLKIAGQALPAYRDYFAKLVAGNPQVIWENRYVPLAETGSLHRDAAFVVLPFLACSQSASLRLAMFFETPVVASAVGELTGFVNQHQVGMLVPPGNVGALRDALLEMSTNPHKRTQYVQNIRQLNRNKNLTWRSIVQDLLRELSEKGW
jgi:glycosyltransferase involved in cell wall biosynthesis